jgi:hypothetical protein
MRNQEEGDETGIGCSTQDIARQQIMVSKYKQRNLAIPNDGHCAKNKRIREIKLVFFLDDTRKSVMSFL